MSKQRKDFDLLNTHQLVMMIIFFQTTPPAHMADSYNGKNKERSFLKD